MRSAVAGLVHTWLILDFFSASRRTGQPGSTLTTTIFGQSFLALVLAALLYPETPPIAFAAANMSLSTLMVAMGYLGDASRPERHHADRFLVGTSPLRPGSLILARCLHGGFFICLITVGMALPPAILLFWISGRDPLVVPAYLVLACVVSAVATGFLAVINQLTGVLMGTARAALLAGTLRAAILAGGFLGFALCLPHLDESRAALPGGVLAVAWPPYWAARLLHGPSALFLALLLGTAGSLLTIAWLTQPLEPRSRARRPRSGLLSMLDRRLAGKGPLLGATVFISTMLYRSPGFRLRTLPLFGLPLAMVVLAFGGGDHDERRLLLGMSLQFPAIYLPFLVAFLPRADQPDAAWIFPASPGANIALAREASLLSLTTHLLLPLQATAFVLLPLTGQGWGTALALTSYSLGTGILVATLHLRHLERMPFTEEGEAIDGDLGTPLGTALVLGVMGAGFSLISDSATGVVLGALILAIGSGRLLRGRRGEA